MIDKSVKKFDAKKIRDLIGLNFDARNYFYSKANETMLIPLWENGFFDEIKKKSEVPTRYSYRMPELDYLARMAEKIPEKVTDIMLAVPVSTSNFNPEVVDRFLWISTKLPADQLARLAPKIRDEKWVSLMAPFNRMGFEYEKILATLFTAKDFESFLLITQVILTVHSEDEIEKRSVNSNTDNPFILSDLSYTKVFEYVIAIDSKYLEKALKITLTALVQAICRPTRQATFVGNFKVEETIHLYDVDFATLQFEGRNHYSYRDDVKDIAATAKILVEKIVVGKCLETDLVRGIYEKYIKTLPDSWSMWRFRLYYLSLCPKLFKAEIKTEIFKIFDYETPGDLLSGAEYERLIKIGLPVLEESDKRAYIAKVIKWFKEKEWKESAHDILSSAFSVLTSDEKKTATEFFGPLDENYTPQPAGGHSRSGSIVSRAPGTEDQWKDPVLKIIELFKTEWSPEALKKRPEGEDFFSPIDAAGAKARLKTEMELRPKEFLDAAELFFARNSLNAHYTYAFINNLADLIREKKIPKGLDFEKVFFLLGNIIKSGVEKPFDPRPEDKKDWYWVGDWDSVNHALAELTNQLIGIGADQPPIDFLAYRPQLVAIIKYLLNNNDPEPKDEIIETAKHKTKSPGDEYYMMSDPFTVAINSVRGRAFQSLVTLAYLDLKEFPKEAVSKIKPDVKALYENTLKKEETRAIMFMFGHYLATFYFADTKWIQNLLPQIFPPAPEKKYLYLAAWEGYLARNLFEEMFFDPQIQKLYEKGLNLTDKEDQDRKYFREFEEGVSNHFALAFMHYKDFGFDHPLFKAFWAGNTEKKIEFISFIGRLFISGSNTGANNLLSTEPRSRERLKELWDWTLKNYTDEKIFNSFGFWISLEKDIFDATWLASHVRQTLEKSKGTLDWEYGLEKSVAELAKIAPQEVLSIANLYFIEGGIHSKSQRHMPLQVEYQWYEAFEILSKNPNTKPGIVAIINTLIKEGGKPFWNLKPLLK